MLDEEQTRGPLTTLAHKAVTYKQASESVISIFIVTICKWWAWNMYYISLLKRALMINLILMAVQNEMVRKIEKLKQEMEDAF